MNTQIPSRGRRLQLLQTHDPHKQWWNLEELRFCTACEKLISGQDIHITLDDREEAHFACPSLHCPGNFETWQYPNLHL